MAKIGNFWLMCSDGSNTILSNIERTRTPYFRTSNELKRVHVMVIQLEHPIFGFEHLNIKLGTSIQKHFTILLKKIEMCWQKFTNF